MQPRIVIPVKVAGKRFAFAFGGRMPEFVDGSAAEIALDPAAIADKYLLKLLQSEQIIELLDPGARVLIAVRPGNISDELRLKTYDADPRPQDLGIEYVEVLLSMPLRLRFGSARRAAFTGGACTIPALDGRQAISLNQAFTFISEVFEPDRQSHVGNAFLSGLFYNESTEAWARLEDLRSTYECEFNNYISAMCQVKSKKQRLAGLPKFPEWLAGKRCQTTFEF